jgi:RHS repeat-associated protein
LAFRAGCCNTYTLKYDALGRTVSRNLNGTITYYYYDGERPIQETNSAGGGIATNYWGIGVDEIVIRFEQGGKQYFFYQDHEGSVTHVRNQYNQLVEQYRYDAFGAPTILSSTSQPLNSSTINNRFMFTGREYNATFGFYEYRARAYHPTLGRFMSEDPKGFHAGDYNLFRYCDNDPEDRTDAMGLDDNGAAAQMRFERQAKGVAEWIGDNELRFSAYAPTAIAYDQAGGNSQYALSGGRTFQVVANIGRLSVGFVNDPAASRGSAIERAMGLQGTKDGSRKDTRRGALYITHYGYPTDAGDARKVNRIGDHSNRLNDDSVALSPDLRRHFSDGEGVYINGAYIGNADDTTKSTFIRTVDVFDPRGIAGGDEWGRIIETGHWNLSSDSHN